MGRNFRALFMQVWTTVTLNWKFWTKLASIHADMLGLKFKILSLELIEKSLCLLNIFKQLFTTTSSIFHGVFYVYAKRELTRHRFSQFVHQTKHRPRCSDIFGIQNHVLTFLLYKKFSHFPCIESSEAARVIYCTPS